MKMTKRQGKRRRKEKALQIKRYKKVEGGRAKAEPERE